MTYFSDELAYANKAAAKRLVGNDHRVERFVGLSLFADKYVLSLTDDDKAPYLGCTSIVVGKHWLAKHYPREFAVMVLSREQYRTFEIAEGSEEQ